MRGLSSDDEAAFTALFAARSPLERLRMTCEMFDGAKVLVEAGIRATDPQISPDELRRRIFDRLYSGDFDPATHARIRASL